MKIKEMAVKDHTGNSFHLSGHAEGLSFYIQGEKTTENKCNMIKRVLLKHCGKVISEIHNSFFFICTDASVVICRKM